MSSDIYIYKMTAVPQEQVGAVGRAANSGGRMTVGAGAEWR